MLQLFKSNINTGCIMTEKSFALEKRFKGIIGKEYELSQKMYPHYNEFQFTIARTLADSLHSYIDDLDHKIPILDLGSGSGMTTYAVLNACDNVFVTFVDNDENMINQAMQFLHSKKSPSDQYFKKDNNHYFYSHNDIYSYLNTKSPNSVGGIVSGWTFHNFDDTYRKKTLEACYDALSCGSIISIGDKIARDDPVRHAKTFNWSINQILDTGRKYNRPEWAHEMITHMVEDEQPGVQWKESAAINDLKHAGFIDVNILYRNHMEAVIVGRKPMEKK